MNARGGKFAVVLLWGGAGLVVLGLVLGYPRLVPYVETLLYSRSIPTAPPLVITPTQESPAAVLMPFEGETLREAAEVSPTPTPTLTPTPAATAAAEAEAEATNTPRPSPTAEPTAVWSGTEPVQISVPSIQLDAPVVPIGWKTERIRGQEQAIWTCPITAPRVGTARRSLWADRGIRCSTVTKPIMVRSSAISTGWRSAIRSL